MFLTNHQYMYTNNLTYIQLLHGTLFFLLFFGNTDITRDDNDPNMLRVPGDLCTYIQRLSGDFTKSLQQTDPNTSEYVERLNNEGKFLSLAQQVQEYYMRHHIKENGNDPNTTPTDYSKNAGLVAIKRIAHMYYKHDMVATKLEKHAASVARFGSTSNNHPSCKNTKAVTDGADATMTHPGCWIGSAVVHQFIPSNFRVVMSELCRFVFSTVSGADKNDMARAQLCQVYYHALHDRFHQARDLMLMSKLEPMTCDIEVG